MRLLLALFMLWLVAGPSLAEGVGWLRLNQVQVIGTHNSYHVAPAAALFENLDRLRPGLADAWDYTHRPLAEQFSELGVRQIELDVFADPKGGRFAKPKPIAGYEPSKNVVAALRRPGFKVFHVQDLDQRSTVATFTAALGEVREWIRENPAEGPILVLVEMKSERPSPLLTETQPFGAAELDAIDAEILSVFNRSQLLTPDDVRGDRGTLREAVLEDGWPLVADLRGKVIFKIDNSALSGLYVRDRPSAEGRPMFPDVAPDRPAAAMMNRNDPVGHFDEIQRLVRRGFLVRTRADSDTLQARTGDTTRRDRALASGAQFVSTDYPEPDRRFTSYRVRFPGGDAMRRNPVTAPE